MPYRHTPVMVREVVDFLDCAPGKTFVDGTLGGGGHARAILEAVGPEGFLIGIDQDPEAVAWARQSLQPFKSNIEIHHDNFTSLPEILRASHRVSVDGILLDLGISLHLVEGSGRGFSFMRDEPLDMRMNPQTEETAEDIVNRFSQDELAGVISRFGEEPWASRIAGRIVQERKRQAIVSSRQLADLVRGAIPRKHWPRRIHPATRTFQALRIVVNRELERLERFLEHAVDLLAPKGRLCILSFHSLEDRMVKEHFRSLARGCDCPPDFPLCTCGKKPVVRILTKRPVQATPSEVEDNPLARSAKLRACEKLERQEG